MATVAVFLEPTRVKLVFIVEWVFFFLITALRGYLATPHQALLIATPLIFFYLAGCTLASLGQDFQQIARGWRLFVLALSLALIDQGIKLWVSVKIPYKTSIPIVNNWLHITHEQNPYGSWVAGVFDIQLEGAIYWLLWGLALLVPIILILFHRRYVTHWRRSLWVDVAFLGIFAGCVSWMLDISIRGYIVDFINLPEGSPPT
jgi:lipoprotein signal peptidase